MLNRLVDACAALNHLLFRAVAWLSLGLAVLGGLIVLLRYGFDFGSIAMQELLLYLHALVLLLAAAHALGCDAHVRVDVFYSRWNARRRAVVDLLGTTLLLWPVAIFLLAVSWDYVSLSWQRLESSAEPGGLPFVYLLKSLILVFAGQLFIQGFVQFRASWRQWRGS